MPQWNVFIFQHFVETILMIYVGLSLLNVKINLKNLVLVSFIQAIVISIVRMPQVMAYLPYGIHSMFLAAVQPLILSKITKISYKVCLMSFLISFVILLFGDAVLAFVVAKTGVSLQNIFSDPTKSWQYVGCATLAHTFLILQAIINYFTKFNLIDITKYEKGEAA